MDHRHTSTLATTPAGAHASRLALVLDFTALYLIAEVVGWLLTRSLALLADAGHIRYTFHWLEGQGDDETNREIFFASRTRSRCIASTRPATVNGHDGDGR